MNFPGHKYMGPGNTTDRGDPVDQDDKISKQHDIEYEKAVTVCDVRKADEKAIGVFGLDAMINKNWHSVVGAVGLGFKYVCETFTGVVYPPNLEKDCTCKEHENKEDKKDKQIS